jgi:aryl-phospho-beta-D-glucosidase BglC (GH1 family)
MTMISRPEPTTQRLCRLVMMIAAILLGPTPAIWSAPVDQLTVSDEFEVFKAGNPHPWSVKTGGIAGGSAKLTPEGAAIKGIFNKPQSGVGVTPRPWPKAQEWVQDPRTCVEVVFEGSTPNLPERVRASVRIQAAHTRKDVRNIETEERAVSEAAVQPDGTRRLRLGLKTSDPVDPTDIVGGVHVVSPEKGEMTITRLSLSKLRNVSVRPVNDHKTFAQKLELVGSTVDPTANVTIQISDADGKTHERRVTAQNGTFSLRWDSPPLTAGRFNSLSARVGDGADAMNVSAPLKVFGYYANTDHVWLRVKGKQIVTSPSSQGGERPFVASGIGYAKDVIIPGQDEDVAAFAKARHLNTIRLPIYNRFFNNRASEPIDLDHHIKTFIDPVVRAAKHQGLYVILDEHCYFSTKINEATARGTQTASRWDEAGVQAWVDGWAKIAEYYKDEPYVLGYELANEPHDIPAETVRDWYGRALKEIRKVDTRHIVLVGNANWTHARALESTWGTVASSFDAPHNNIVYAFHDYPEDDHPVKVQKSITQFRDKHNVPVFCTEFGATWWDKDETTCREFQTGMLALFARENVGWTIWALSGLVDKPRTATPLPDKVREEKNIPRLPKHEYDSCAYSDIWVPMARIMATDFPEPAKGK